MASVCFTLKETASSFPRGAAQFYTSPNNVWQSQLLHPPALGIASFCFTFFFTFEIYSSIDLLRYKSQAITCAGFKDTAWLTSVLVHSYGTTTTVNIQIHSRPFYCPPPKASSACSPQSGQSTGLWPCPLPPPISYHLPFTEFHINGVTQWVGFSLSVFWDPAILLCLARSLLWTTI